MMKEHKATLLKSGLVLVAFMLISVSCIQTVRGYEVGVEWTNDYGFWYNDPDEGWGLLYDLDNMDNIASGFYGELVDDGWTGKFNLGNDLAWEQDFKKENLEGGDDSVDETVDFAFYAGHGSPTGFYFNNWNDDPKLRGTESHHDARWGDGDMEWIALYCCKVLKNSDDHGDWTQRWGFDVFNGLHQILGFGTQVDGVNPNYGSIFADYMIEDEYTIKTSWFMTAEDLCASGTEAVAILAPNANDDHLWGHGSVSSDVEDPSSLGWAHHTV